MTEYKDLIKSAKAYHNENLNQSKKHLQVALIAACKTNDYSLVDTLLKREINVNYVWAKKFSALSAAIRMKNQDIIKMLIDHNADVNMVVDGFTPLSETIDNNDFISMKLLLDNGADPNKRFARENMTPVSKAILLSNFELVELLLSYGANLNEFAFKNISTYDLLFDKAKIEDLKRISKYIDINFKSFNNRDLLSMAISYNRSDIFDFLLELGVDPCYVENNCSIPLITAVKLNKIEVIKKIIDLGVNINAPNYSYFNYYLRQFRIKT